METNKQYYLATLIIREIDENGHVQFNHYHGFSENDAFAYEQAINNFHECHEYWDNEKNGEIQKLKTIKQIRDYYKGDACLIETRIGLDHPDYHDAYVGHSIQISNMER